MNKILYNGKKFREIDFNLARRMTVMHGNRDIPGIVIFIDDERKYEGYFGEASPPLKEMPHLADYEIIKEPHYFFNQFIVRLKSPERVDTNDE